MTTTCHTKDDAPSSTAAKFADKDACLASLISCETHQRMCEIKLTQLKQALYWHIRLCSLKKQNASFRSCSFHICDFITKLLLILIVLLLCFPFSLTLHCLFNTTQMSESHITAYNDHFIFTSVRCSCLISLHFQCRWHYEVRV